MLVALAENGQRGRERPLWSEGHPDNSPASIFVYAGGVRVYRGHWQTLTWLILQI